MADSTNSNIHSGSSTDRATVWLDPDQVDAMRTECYTGEFAEYLQARNDALIALAFDTGLRVGELVQVDVSMLRDSGASLYLPTAIQKDYPNSNSPPPVTINLASDTTRTVNSFLASRWKDSAALFPSRKADRITEQGVRYVVSDAAAAADIEPYLLDGSRGGAAEVTPHALRHSVAYRMLHVEEDNTLYDVRNRLRHASIQTTERVYDHFEVV
jgi:integrase/recombinase XerD